MWEQLKLRQRQDLWAKLVDDRRWSYDGLLPYFKRTETHYGQPGADPAHHGYSGPMRTTAAARKYPLDHLMKQAFLDAGLDWNADANAGNPLGVAAYTENWRDGKRQPSGKAYGLAGVDVVTSSTVQRILLEGDGPKAVGVELASGEKILADKEVILSCGAIRSPQILMLSGIGAEDELAKHKIQQIVDSPEVGLNFNDHCCLAQFFRVGRLFGDARENIPNSTNDRSKTRRSLSWQALQAGPIRRTCRASQPRSLSRQMRREKNSRLR